MARGSSWLLDSTYGCHSAYTSLFGNYLGTINFGHVERTIGAIQKPTGDPLAIGQRRYEAVDLCQSGR